MDADAEVIQMGVDFLKIVALSFGFMGAQLALVGALRGSGNRRIYALYHNWRLDYSNFRSPYFVLRPT